MHLQHLLRPKLGILRPMSRSSPASCNRSFHLLWRHFSPHQPPDNFPRFSRQPIHGLGPALHDFLRGFGFVFFVARPLLGLLHVIRQLEFFNDDGNEEVEENIALNDDERHKVAAGASVKNRRFAGGSENNVKTYGMMRMREVRADDCKPSHTIETQSSRVMT